MIGATDAWVLEVPDEDPAVDDEGRVHITYTPVEVQGRVDEVSAREVEVAAQRGQRHDIVCLADPDVLVTDKMRVVVSTPERLAGRYTIDAVRTTRRHQRVLCSRDTTGEE